MIKQIHNKRQLNHFPHFTLFIADKLFLKSNKFQSNRKKIHLAKVILFLYQQHSKATQMLRKEVTVNSGNHYFIHSLPSFITPSPSPSPSLAFQGILRGNRKHTDTYVLTASSLFKKRNLLSIPPPFSTFSFFVQKANRN